MHMTSGHIPDWLLLITNAIALIAIIIAAWRMDHKIAKTLSFGFQIATVFIVLCALYAFVVGVKPGMTIHWLGVMMTVMMFGPWVAILLLSSLHIFFALALNIGDMDTIGFNIAVTTVTPVIIATLIHSLFYYKCPRIFPIYIAQVGLGDLLCMLSVDVLLTIVLHQYFTYPDFSVFQDFTLLLALMGGMEALISTWVASILIIYLPSWLVTFSDEEYINGK